MSDTALLLDDNTLQKIYTWVDEIPLSRPKRNITRDFSDGVLLAEVIAHYFPQLVEKHNYSAANSVRQKLYNWSTLNSKVLRRLNFPLDKAEIETIVACRPGAVELLLMRLQQHLADIRAKKTIPGSPSSVKTPTFNPAHSVQKVTPRSPAVNTPAQPVFSDPAPSNNNNNNIQQNVPQQFNNAPAVTAADLTAIQERDATIEDLKSTIEILELKIQKLDQLVRLKDARIVTLTARLGEQS